MSWASDFFSDVADSLMAKVLRRPRRRTSSTGRAGTSRSTRSTRTSAPTSRPTRTSGPATASSPGQSGRSATTEVDPTRIGRVRMTYAPRLDSEPDPGEVVWTWVPYQEGDGRGKDRPVLIVAAESGKTTWLAVQLTSKPHSAEASFVAVGTGAWDSEGRASWVNLERVLRIHGDGIRRESVALDGYKYAKVEEALRSRYDWS